MSYSRSKSSVDDDERKEPVQDEVIIADQQNAPDSKEPTINAANKKDSQSSAMKSKMDAAAAKFIAKRKKQLKISEKPVAAVLDDKTQAVAVADVIIQIDAAAQSAQIDAPKPSARNLHKQREEKIKQAKKLIAKRGDTTYLGGHVDSVATRQSHSQKQSVEQALRAPFFAAYLRWSREALHKEKVKEKAKQKTILDVQPKVEEEDNKLRLA